MTLFFIQSVKFIFSLNFFFWKKRTDLVTMTSLESRTESLCKYAHTNSRTHERNHMLKINVLFFSGKKIQYLDPQCTTDSLKKKQQQQKKTNKKTRDSSSHIFDMEQINQEDKCHIEPFSLLQ